MGLVNFDRLLTGPTYAVFGTSATLTLDGVDYPVTVIDQSDGGVNALARGQQVAFLPMVSIAAASCPVPDPSGAILTLSGRTWAVQSATPETVDGEFSGDLLLEIAEAS